MRRWGSQPDMTAPAAPAPPPLATGVVHHSLLPDYLHDRSSPGSTDQKHGATGTGTGTAAAAASSKSTSHIPGSVRGHKRKGGADESSNAGSGGGGGGGKPGAPVRASSTGSLTTGKPSITSDAGLGLGTPISDADYEAIYGSRGRDPLEDHAPVLKKQRKQPDQSAAAAAAATATVTPVHTGLFYGESPPKPSAPPASLTPPATDSAGGGGGGGGGGDGDHSDSDEYDM